MGTKWFDNKETENFKKTTGFGFDSDGNLKLLPRKNPMGSPYAYYNSGSFDNDLHKYVVNQLIDVEKLVKVQVPEGSWERTGTFLLTSRKYESKETLLIIAAPSVGIWDIPLIKYGGIYYGTQLPYVRKAKEMNYGLIITNSGHPHSGLTAPEHLLHVWNTYVSRCSASSIVFVVEHIGKEFLEFAEMAPNFKERVRAAAFVLSRHIYGNYPTKFAVNKFMIKISRHWTKTRGVHNMDTALETPENDIQRVSADCSSWFHTISPNVCLESIFKFLHRRIMRYHLKHRRVEWRVLQLATTTGNHVKEKKHAKQKKYDMIKTHLRDLDRD